MWLLPIVIVLQAAQAAPATATVTEVQASAVQSDPVVHIGLFAYQSDGQLRSFVTTGGNSQAGPLSPGFVYVSGCRMGAGGSMPPDGTQQAWRLSGQVVEFSPQQAIVELTAQRIIRDGQTVTDPAAMQRVVIADGSPVSLEVLFVSPNDTCQVAKVALEARLARRIAYAGSGGRAGGSFGGGGTSVGAGAGAGGASGGGGVTVVRAGGGSGGGRAGAGGAAAGGIGSGGGTGSGSGGGSGGSATAVAGPGGVAGVGTGSTAAAAGPVYDVDLWLVRTPASGSETVTHATLRVDRSGGQVQFAPVVLTNAQGTTTVQVRASIALAGGGATPSQLSFTTSRSVSFAPSGRPARDPIVSSGTTTVAMPGPNDVLSFEMPGVRVPGGPTIDDQFSVRVRFTPRK